jgi:hypothetical protein
LDRMQEHNIPESYLPKTQGWKSKFFIFLKFSHHQKLPAELVSFWSKSEDSQLQTTPFVFNFCVEGRIKWWFFWIQSHDTMTAEALMYHKTDRRS